MQGPLWHLIKKEGPPRSKVIPVKAMPDLKVTKAIRGDIWTWGMGFAVPFRDIVHVRQIRGECRSC